MLEKTFLFLDLLEDSIWAYIGFPFIIFFGLYFSLKTRFFQIRRFPAICKIFLDFLQPKTETRGVHPLKAFFASIGGCIGIGNVVGVCSAVQIGGPGALFWLWLTGLLGMLLKYSEVYLGVKFRISHQDGSYSGGPMYYLQHAFGVSWIPKLVCILLCFYGVEIYMFRVITDSIAINLSIHPYLVAILFLPIVLLGGLGGVRRVGNICSAIIPFFLLVFGGMSLWVFAQNLSAIPAALGTVFRSAFTGHAAVGGFAGSTLMTTISYGIRRACYTGDIGIGYASVIHSETSTSYPHKQASLAIFGIFLDTFVICTLSILLLIITDAWSEGIDPTLVIQAVLSRYFPFMPFFMSLLIFLLGYSSLIAFLCVGLKSAKFLFPRHGLTLYFSYAAVALIASIFIDSNQALTMMSATGALLLLINLTGIIKMRKEIVF